jgi:hypothetical protein
MENEQPPQQSQHNTSDLLQLVVVQNVNDKLSIGEIKNMLHERGFGVLLVIAAIPICLPIPAPPGFTTVFSLPLIIFSLQMICGMRSPWLPRWLTDKKISRKGLEKLVQKAAPWLRKIESYLHPRITYISVPAWERIIGIFVLIFSITIALPIPMINFLPGWGVMIMSLGLLSKDGLVIIGGMIVGTIGVGIALIAVILIWAGVAPAPL